MSDSFRYDVAGTGSMVVDLICQTQRLIGPDEKILLDAERGPALQRLVGGVTLNHLGWARILGLRCAIFGKQADDPEGRFLRAGMDALGIDHHMDLSGSSSSFAHVYVDSRGARAIYMARGATGELTAAEVDARHAPVIASARLISSEVSQVPLAAVRRVLERARESGARSVVDLDVPIQDAVPGLGSEEELHAVLQAADLIKASIGAVEGLVRAREPESIGEELAQRYQSEAVVLTLGDRGAAVWTDGKLTSAPAPEVRVVDTTGAGDAFLGGLLAGLTHELAWSDALDLATSCGAACCERLGGFPDDPAACRERVLELYRAGGGAPFAAEIAPAAAPSPAPAQPRPRPATERFLRVAPEEITRGAERVDPAAIAASAELILAAEGEGGRVHVTGIGKPEHVARYGAALLSSTGTPATFLDGTESTHGSVGQLRPGDVLVAISNSGETGELLACVAAAQNLGARILAVTARVDSSLARAADGVLEASARDEGGPLGLAPRTSVLVQTLVLQALSVELQARRDFSRSDYHARHPHGTLGALSRRSEQTD